MTLRQLRLILVCTGASLTAWAACSSDTKAPNSAPPAAGQRQTTNPVTADKPAAQDASATSADETITDDVLHQLATALIATCPVVAADDAAAREDCANGLGDLALLRDLSADPLLWGGQPAGLALEQVPEQATLTRFNPFVWRKIYLSTLMFEGPALTESAGRYRVLRVPSRFRNGLDSGDYPYPFWHTEKKWLSYEQTTHIVFLFEGSQLIAGFRSEQVDLSRSHSARTWEGAWTWDQDTEPHATLFQALFSPANPVVPSLDASYRALAEGLREQTCTTCHNPSNPANEKPLDILNYPNQSLSGRHRIVAMLEQNQMPPDVGIADEAVRLALLERARKFAVLGDQALAFEGEPVADDAEDKHE